jgi:hypothetical protein
MAEIKLRVAKISAKTTNGNYIHTLKSEGVEHEILGKKVVTGARTYFLALTESAVLGSTHNVDMDKFTITTREMVGADGEVRKGDNGQPIKLKWLNFK